MRVTEAAQAAPMATVEPRPGDKRALSKVELLRISLYWLAISGLWAGLTFTLLPLISQQLICGTGVDATTCATMPIQQLSPAVGGIRLRPEVALGFVLLVGSAVAFVVQPVAAALSDYTRSRLGRRRPWILVGTSLDVVFLALLTLLVRDPGSQAFVGMAVLIVLLQFSSNLAQGPFQGYVPDLVPDEQVGLASGLVGTMTVSGQLLGAGIAGVAIALGEPWLGIIGLAVLEVSTMLPAVFGVADRPVEMPKRAGSMIAGVRGAAAEAWGHRSFVWLLVSRFFILMTVGSVTALAFFFLTRSLVYTSEEAATAIVILLAVTVLTAALVSVIAGPISDRVGRRQMIWLSCAIGAVGLALLATTTAQPELVIGGARFPLGGLAAVPIGVGAGMFVSVDWALMVDIIPKVTAGRYMGISNVVTATSGAIAGAIGGVVIATTTSLTGDAALGPRVALGLAVSFYGLGALALTRVDTRPFEVQMAERRAKGALAAATPTT
ncbi:MAG TPA: MFS transporter [Candidatus Saccharimonadia bacterium]|nr:MFS transporter [Candidatus Saccharimonadia bacterium]